MKCRTFITCSITSAGAVSALLLLCIQCSRSSQPHRAVIQKIQDCLLKRVQKYETLYDQLDATEVFIADLIACSTCFGHHYAHHQELKSIIQWLLPVVFRAVVFKSCKPDT